MNKSFQPVSLLLWMLLFGILPAAACISEAPTHNAYLFSVYDNALMENNPFTDKVNRYWRNYVGSSEDYFDCVGDSTLSINTARTNGDLETAAYLHLLYKYIAASSAIYNGWDYPTKEQLNYYHRVLRDMLAASRSYRGKRLRSQYALMQMRALFAQKSYMAAANVWAKNQNTLSPSVFRDLMRNLYAGCLLRMNQKRQAVEIYAEQQDFASLKFCVRNYRILAGIKSVYAQNPNSATLVYLVQDFVNNAQETFDLFESKTPKWFADNNDSTKIGWLKEIDRKAIYRQEALDFVAFAQQVVAEGKTKTPCLWQTAIGCIHHVLGDTQSAEKELKAALNMAGTSRMKANARAIYAVNSVSVNHPGNAYLNWIAQEMDWLKAESKKEIAGRYNHYNDVLDRLIFNNLVPALRKAGMGNLSLALIASQQSNLWYSGEYFDELQKLSADQLVDYVKWCKKPSDNALETYARHHAPSNDNYYNDLVGTRLLACARWAEAIPYLEKVDNSFLCDQGIAPYAKKMDFNADRWITDQKLDRNEMNDDVKLTANKKIDFCKQMIQEEAKYRLMRNGLDKRRQAYKLASLYYQASYEGDCWWLTQYGVSCTQDSALVGTKDFVAETIRLLNAALAPKWNKKEEKRAFDLQQKTVYALAFIRHDPMLTFSYDENYNEIATYQPHSRQYLAMQRLLDFSNRYPQQIAPYISRCDVLKKFANKN